MRPPHRAHREIRAASCSTQAQKKASIGEDYSTLEGAWVASSVSDRRGLPACSAPFLRSYGQRVRRSSSPRWRTLLSTARREAAGEVIARTAIEPHALAILTGDDAEAVV